VGAGRDQLATASSPLGVAPFIIGLGEKFPHLRGASAPIHLLSLYEIITTVLLFHYFLFIYKERDRGTHLSEAGMDTPLIFKILLRQDFS